MKRRKLFVTDMKKYWRSSIRSKDTTISCKRKFKI